MHLFIQVLQAKCLVSFQRNSVGALVYMTQTIGSSHNSKQQHGLQAFPVPLHTVAIKPASRANLQQASNCAEPWEQQQHPLHCQIPPLLHTVTGKEQDPHRSATAWRVFWAFWPTVLLDISYTAKPFHSKPVNPLGHLHDKQQGGIPSLAFPSKLQA